MLGVFEVGSWMRAVALDWVLSGSRVSAMIGCLNDSYLEGKQKGAEKAHFMVWTVCFCVQA